MSWRPSTATPRSATSASILNNVDGLGRAGRRDLRHPHESRAADLHRIAVVVQRADRHHPGRIPRRPGAATDQTDRHRAVRTRRSPSPAAIVKLKRYDGYKPNTAFEQRTGFGGYKQACLDTVTFRIVTEPGARVAGLQTGELQAVEDMPTKSVPDLKRDPTSRSCRCRTGGSRSPFRTRRRRPRITLTFRRAVQAALDMDEIMDAASDGNYKLNVGFQYPNQPDYTDAGKETYNINDPALAKKLPGGVRLQ